MEKTPMYAVVTPPHPCKRQWVAWVATGVSIIALVVACVTAAVAVQQVDRVTTLEDRMLEMQSHMEEILRFTISSHDYLEYEEDANDSQLGPYEELTLQRVVRKKRQADGTQDSTQAPVPIYDQSYGIKFKGWSNSNSLSLYESLQDLNSVRDPTSPEVTVESTASPIQPHHRISSMWVPPKRPQWQQQSGSGPQLSSRASLNGYGDDYNDSDDDDYSNVVTTTTNRRPPVLKRPSRTMSLHGSGREVRPQQKTRVQSNSIRVPVLFRKSLVKATSRHDGYPGRKRVTPQPPERVPQREEILERTLQNTAIGPRMSSYKEDPRKIQQDARRTQQDPRKKKRPGKRHGRRRRRSRSPITVAHFVASPLNRTSRHGYTSGEARDEWSPAAWMDKLGFNSMYRLDRGIVTVRDAGLYYLYAQVLYEAGRFGSGFQIMVDGIPLMECTLAPTQPSHSCFTAGATYLPKNADVYVRDLEQHAIAVKRQENSFFGLMKLMGTPKTAEELLLG